RTPHGVRRRVCGAGLFGPGALAATGLAAAPDAPARAQDLGEQAGTGAKGGQAVHGGQGPSREIHQVRLPHGNSRREGRLPDGCFGVALSGRLLQGASPCSLGGTRCPVSRSLMAILLPIENRTITPTDHRLTGKWRPAAPNSDGSRRCSPPCPPGAPSAGRRPAAPAAFRDGGVRGGWESRRQPRPAGCDATGPRCGGGRAGPGGRARGGPAPRPTRSPRTRRTAAPGREAGEDGTLL